MPRSVLRIGTRSSALALAQAESVRRAIQEVITKRNFELVPVNTAGDEHVGELPRIGGKGLFVTDIQEALAEGKVDLAVHSAKDLPATSPEQIVMASIPPRVDPRDALLTRRGSGLAALKPGTTVGTSSLRRSAILLSMQRGLVPVSIRGNVDTRLRKLSAGEVDALVLAMAGLKRLGKEGRVSEILPFDVMLPAPGQGCLAVECRATDKDMRAALAQIEDPASRRAFDAERAFLLAMGGDCNLPLGALAKLDGPDVILRAVICSPDGTTVIRDSETSDDPVKAGEVLAERMLAAGGAEIVAAIRGLA